MHEDGPTPNFTFNTSHHHLSQDCYPSILLEADQTQSVLGKLHGLLETNDDQNLNQETEDVIYIYKCLQTELIPQINEYLARLSGEDTRKEVFQ